MAGFLAPSSGTVTLDGEPVWRHEEGYRRTGLLSEREAVHDTVSGRDSVLANARPHQLPDLERAVRRALGADEALAVDLLGGFAPGTLVPLLGLVAGTGAEIDDGSIVRLLS